jgi:hypothetical protein
MPITTPPDKPAWQFWRILAKRPAVTHLLPLVIGEGSGTVALCGLLISDTNRQGTVGTIMSPKGDECMKCLNIATFYNNQALAPEQKRRISRLGAWPNVLQIMGNTRLTKAQKQKAIDAVSRASRR